MDAISTTFRSSISETPEVVVDPKVKVDHGRVQKTTVEPPFTEFRNEHKIPFTADYMGTPLTWDEQDMVGDVTTIEEYLKELVSIGELENTTKSAGEKLKGLEKMAGIDKLESKAQRLIKLATFITYLKSLDRRTHGIL
jgi:hypothetical protein